MAEVGEAVGEIEEAIEDVEAAHIRLAPPVSRTLLAA
jgi:hypothetical protein